MTQGEARQVICLHERAERHFENYKKLSRDKSAQPKALDQLRKVQHLHSQISGIVKGSYPIPS